MHADPDRPAFDVFSLGELLRDRRRRAGLTVEKLAQRVGCSKGYLSAIETGRHDRPSDELLTRLEAELGFQPGELVVLLRMRNTHPSVRRELSHLRARHEDAQRLAQLLHQLSGSPDRRRGEITLDEAHASGELRKLIDRLAPDGSETPDTRADAASDARSDAQLVPLPREVPLINSVAAGYPADFTDLGYPARAADEYVRCPDIADPDAFAARVVGDSMTPEYREGDVVVFSPAKTIKAGADCFARLEPDHETTFKRIFFETSPAGEELIRLQPLNPSYPPNIVPREQVAGLYAAVTVMRRIG